jgi:hypothetical protein
LPAATISKKASLILLQISIKNRLPPGTAYKVRTKAGGFVRKADCRHTLPSLAANTYFAVVHIAFFSCYASGLPYPRTPAVHKHATSLRLRKEQPSDACRNEEAGQRIALSLAHQHG